MPDEVRSRLSRLTAILLLLQSRKLLTATGISRKFGVSIRTVYRDIRALEEAGVPVLTEEGKGYSLMQGYSVPPVMFTEAEANALVTAEQLIRKNKDASFIRDYTDAVTKIRAVLRYGIKDRSELLAGRVVFRQNTEELRTSNHLSAIQQALTGFRVIRILYSRPEEPLAVARFVEPFALYHTQDNWIMVAWCRLRSDFRSFRLDRIQELRTEAEHFSPHKLSLPEYFEICRKKTRPPLT